MACRLLHLLEMDLGIFFIVTGPAKRNCILRCIILLFPLSKAPAYWLLKSFAGPIMLRSRSAVRLHKGPLMYSHVHENTHLLQALVPSISFKMSLPSFLSHVLDLLFEMGEVLPPV